MCRNVCSPDYSAVWGNVLIKSNVNDGESNGSVVEARETVGRKREEIKGAAGRQAVTFWLLCNKRLGIRPGRKTF